MRYKASIPAHIPANVPEMLDLLPPSIRRIIIHRRIRASPPYRQTPDQKRKNGYVDTDKLHICIFYFIHIYFYNNNKRIIFVK